MHVDDEFDRTIVDPEGINRHTGSPQSRRRDEARGLWPKRFPIGPRRFGWSERETIYHEERRRLEPVVDSRSRDALGRFVKTEGSSDG